MHKSASLRIRAFDFLTPFRELARYNVSAMKRLFVTALILCCVFLIACKKSSTASSDASKSADAISQKLQELAGSAATDCGRIKSQEVAVVQPASDCAIKAAESKHAFYVAYDLPGLTTAVAGNSQGNLFSVQAQDAGSGSPKLESTPCPAALRLAQSGRVTCYPPGGGMGSMSGGTSPHGGMGMPPATGQNPHGESPAPSHGKTSVPK
jgi:hypothetical protein